MTLLVRLLNAPLWIRRVVALSMAGASALSVLAAGWIATGLLADLRAEIEAKRTELGQLLATAAMAEKLQAWDKGAIPSSAAVEFLAGDNEAIVRSELQRRIGELAAANALEVLSAGNAPALSEDGLTYVGIRVSLAGSIEGMHSSVLGLETSLPLLFIREATFRTSATGREAPGEIPQPLSAELAIYGAMAPKRIEGAGQQ